MCYFSHKDILIKSYFYRKGIQVWKHVSDSNSADYIIPCSKTSLDSITYKVNSEFFIVTFQGLHSLAPNFLPSLYFTTNSLDASQSVILTWSPNILHCPCSHSVWLPPPSPSPSPCFILPLKFYWDFKMLRVKPHHDLPWFLGRLLLPNACNFFQLWIMVKLLLLLLFKIYFKQWFTSPIELYFCSSPHQPQLYCAIIGQ